jgi:hypothetical protein
MMRDVSGHVMDKNRQETAPNSTANKPAEKNPFSLQQLAELALPPTFQGRWITKRKAWVIAHINLGKLTVEEACQRYHLSPDELLSWQRAFDRHGLNGLQATKEQSRRRFNQ